MKDIQNKPEAITESSLEWMPKSVWGPIKWKELHSRGLCSLSMEHESDWFDAFLRGLPCPDCRRHFEEFLGRSPPVFSDRQAFFEWTVAAHNFVNRRVGKPEITIEAARFLHAFGKPDES